MIPKEKIDEIRARASILQVVSEHVALKKQGSGYVGLCPFHSEKTPSFSVNEHKEIYYCFGCNEGGNVISFVMKLEGLTFPEAARKLGERYGVDVEAEKSAVTSFKDSLYKINRAASAYFTEVLYSRDGAKARQYLKGRGFSDKEFLNTFGVGCAPDGWDGLVGYLRRKGFSVELAQKAGLVAAKKGGNGYYDRFRSRLIFPITDRSGRVIGFGARALDEDNQPKYLNSPETVLFKKGTVLFGLFAAWQSITKESAAIVVEGYFDVLAMHRAGFTNTVASMGTAMTEGHVRALKGCNGPVYTLFDMDDAGKKAALRSLGVFLEEDVPCRMIKLGFGKDPDEFIAAKGAEAMKSAVAEAGTLMDFFFDELEGGKNLATPEGKRAYFDAAIQQLGRINNVVEQAHYVPRIANAVSLPEATVFSAINSTAGGARGKRERQAQANTETLFSSANSATRRVSARAELTLLKVILKHPDLYSERVCAAIDEFEDPELKRAGRVVAACIETGPVLDFTLLLERLEDSKLKGWVADATLNDDDGFVVDPERMLNDSIAKILHTDSLKPATLKMIKDLEESGRFEEARQVRERARRPQSAKRL